MKDLMANERKSFDVTLHYQIYLNGVPEKEICKFQREIESHDAIKAIHEAKDIADERVRQDYGPNAVIMDFIKIKIKKMQ